jgi:hypothetical protein
MLLQGLFDCFQRLRILSFRQLGPGFQPGPIFIPRSILDFPRGESRAFGILAGPEELLGIANFSGSAGRKEN